MAKPVLVLQMQRMGDLILSFPLMGMLQNIYAGHPLWTVAEEQFFTPLMPMAPQTVFFPPAAAPKLMQQSYRAVINLSHRPDAALIAGSVKAEERFGAYTQQGTTRIEGAWALYRASIVHNNRYNLFHWSDIYLLDHIQGHTIPPCNVNVHAQARGKTIGIFVGASEIEKRPSATHFAHIAKALSHKGYKTLFLGGPQEKALGQEIESLSGLKGASLCGKFSLQQLAHVLQNLALFITPDTGPMHLAAWLNTPVLNLSLGPVNPWETGPRSTHLAQHTLMQPKLSCAGCWQACSPTPPCHAKLSASAVARVAHALIQEQSTGTMQASPKNTAPSFSGIHIYQSTQTEQGLFTLVPSISEQSPPSSRQLLARFWQQWFWLRLHKAAQNNDLVPQKEFQDLAHAYPQLAEKLQLQIVHFGKHLRQELKNTLIHKKCTLTNTFWENFPPYMHPFSSYAYLYLQNKEYSLKAWEEIIGQMEYLYKSTQ